MSTCYLSGINKADSQTKQESPHRTASKQLFKRPLIISTSKQSSCVGTLYQVGEVCLLVNMLLIF
jgi:hypothetical protein